VTLGGVVTVRRVSAASAGVGPAKCLFEMFIRVDGLISRMYRVAMKL
jgi:hypothetical protein